VDVIRDQLPRVRWAELTRHGFLVVALTDQEGHCDWWHVDLDDGGAEVAASWVVRPSAPVLEEAVPLAARSEPPPRPPVTTAAPGTTSTMVSDGDRSGGRSRRALVGGVAAGGAAAIAALVALRRRRDR
jgi:hypothetical protein